MDAYVTHLTQHLKAPEGTELDPEVTKAFAPIAHKLGLNPRQAQELVNFQATLNQQALENHGNTVAQWATEAENDKEIGGQAFEQNLGIAKRGLDAVGTPALKELLKVTGIGNHPEVIRAFVKIGRQLGEAPQPGGGNPAGSGQSAAQVLYGGSQSQ